MPINTNKWVTESLFKAFDNRIKGLETKDKSTVFNICKPSRDSLPGKNEIINTEPESVKMITMKIAHHTRALISGAYSKVDFLASALTRSITSIVKLPEGSSPGSSLKYLLRLS